MDTPNETKRENVKPKCCMLPKWLKLVLSIIAIEVLGSLGAIFTATSAGSWYSTINKPAFNPPNWVFGPVWTTLFLLMGISFYLVWTGSADSTLKKPALRVFILQMILNILWSPAFFGMKLPYLGLLVITFLWFAIVITMIRFKKVSKTASFLLLPYLLWVTFAAILNLYIAILN